MRLFLLKGFLAVVLLINFAPCVCAQDDGLYLLSDSKYFRIYLNNQVSPEYLLTRLDYDYFVQPDTIGGPQAQGSVNVIAKTADALYAEVSDILDIHIYSFKGDLKILADRQAVKDAFFALLGNDFSERSFYLPEKNVIYISAADITVGMLGHEMAHAIISSYFVVPPPAKLQEVLCGYVEYSLSKKVKAEKRQKKD